MISSLLSQYGFLIVLAPVIAFFAYVFKLQGENNSLKDDVARHEAKEVVSDAIHNLQEAKKDADAKEDEFNRALDEYRNAGNARNERDRSK